ncbi:MAG: NUDIX hydrolase [Candidatus Diapherotrites archaeon]|nr:NUDIX hydrolase [Candidatus Diapherotrites archaeon]
MQAKYFFIIPQKACIRKGNKFLIVKRSLDEDPYPGYWDFPGGKLEKGESAEKGLHREVFEETQLHVNVKKPIFCYTEVLKEKNLLFIVYDCSIKNGKIKLSSEHSEYQWATRKEILQLKAEPYMKAFFRIQKN